MKSKACCKSMFRISKKPLLCGQASHFAPQKAHKRFWTASRNCRDTREKFTRSSQPKSSLPRCICFSAILCASNRQGNAPRRGPPNQGVLQKRKNRTKNKTNLSKPRSVSNKWVLRKKMPQLAKKLWAALKRDVTLAGASCEKR